MKIVIIITTVVTMCGIFSFLGCYSPTQVKSGIYQYGAKEFEDKMRKMNLSIEQAVILASDYYFKTVSPNSYEYSFELHIIYGDNYIFTTVLHNPKQLKYNMTGIWVNGMTGEVKYIETKKWTNVDLSHFPINTYVSRIKK